MLHLIVGLALAAVPQQLVVAAGADSSPSGAFQARLGVYPLNVNVAEPLVRLTPDFRVEAQLATSWEYLGKNTWRFHLWKGVKFHDGQPLTCGSPKLVASRILDVSRTGPMLAGLMLRFALLLASAVRSAFRSRADLTIENLALRQQPNLGRASRGSSSPIRLGGIEEGRWVSASHTA